MFMKFRKFSLSLVCIFVFMSAVPASALVDEAIIGAAIEWGTKKALDYLWDYLNESEISGDVKTVEIKADNGHPESQCNVGSMYYNGEGTARDESEALVWWSKAADQGKRGSKI